MLTPFPGPDSANKLQGRPCPPPHEHTWGQAKGKQGLPAKWVWGLCSRGMAWGGRGGEGKDIGGPMEGQRHAPPNLRGRGWDAS